MSAQNLFEIVMSNEVLSDVEILPKNGFKGGNQE